MNIQELDKLYDKLGEIEAFLGILSNTEESTSVIYISILSYEYYEKIKEIRKYIKKVLEK